MANDADLDDLRDATLARYLRHNSWHVAPAVKQMQEYIVSETAETNSSSSSNGGRERSP